MKLVLIGRANWSANNLEVLKLHEQASKKAACRPRGDDLELLSIAFDSPRHWSQAYVVSEFLVTRHLLSELSQVHIDIRRAGYGRVSQYSMQSHGILRTETPCSSRSVVSSFGHRTERQLLQDCLHEGSKSSMYAIQLRLEECGPVPQESVLQRSFHAPSERGA